MTVPTTVGVAPGKEEVWRRTSDPRTRWSFGEDTHPYLTPTDSLLPKGLTRRGPEREVVRRAREPGVERIVTVVERRIVKGQGLKSERRITRGCTQTEGQT